MEILYYVIFLGLGLIIGYLSSYMNKKGENLATKEDIEVITDIVEKTKSMYINNLEELKNNFKNQNDILTIRRQVYTDMVNSIRIFISGTSNNVIDKQHFLSNYSIIWLWATDEIINKLNQFLDLQIKTVLEPGSVTQIELKRIFTECLIAMRKDVGFLNTNVSNGDYRFLQFN